MNSGKKWAEDEWKTKRNFVYGNIKDMFDKPLDLTETRMNE